jgi:hypothetical protein
MDVQGVALSRSPFARRRNRSASCRLQRPRSRTGGKEPRQRSAACPSAEAYTNRRIAVQSATGRVRGSRSFERVFIVKSLPYVPVGERLRYLLDDWRGEYQLERPITQERLDDLTGRAFGIDVRACDPKRPTDAQLNATASNRAKRGDSDTVGFVPAGRCDGNDLGLF